MVRREGERHVGTRARERYFFCDKMRYRICSLDNRLLKMANSVEAMVEAQRRKSIMSLRLGDDNNDPLPLGESRWKVLYYME